MRHNAQHKAATACPATLLVSSLAIIDPSPVYAISLDDMERFVAVSREFVLSSHWTTFGVGCACGTILGGLFFGIRGRRRNRELRKELEELRMSASMRSKAASIDDQGNTQVRESAEQTEHVWQADSQTVPIDTAAQAGTGQEKDDFFRPDMSPSSTVAIPKSQFGPKARASYINHRIARFDESLFPDNSNIVTHDVDMFEAAMQAMEDSLRDPGSFYEQDTGFIGYNTGFNTGIGYNTDYTGYTGYTGYTHATQAESSNDFDATAYIERIMQEEIDRGLNHTERGFSREHLTVFDGAGTGDLAISRKTRTYVPRHMSVILEEA